MTNIQASQLPGDAAEGWSEQFFRELGAGRQQAEQLLAAQDAQLDCLEARLAVELQQLTAELEASRGVADSEHATAQRQSALLAEQTADLERLKEERSRRELVWEEAQKEAARTRQAFFTELREKEDQLEQRAREIQSAESSLRQAQRVQSANEAEIIAEKERAARTNERLEQQLLRVETEREALAAEQGRTKAQRRRIARDFKEQRSAALEQLERRKAELLALSSRRNGDLEATLDRTQAEVDELRQQAAQLRKLLNDRTSELHERRDEIQRLTVTAGDQAQQIARLSAEQERLSRELNDHASHDGNEQQLAGLLAESDQLRKRLSEVEQQRRSQPDIESERHKREDLQRRFELAVSEVRELKRKNGELEHRMSSGSGGPSPIAHDHNSGRLDWESQKRRMLEALESEQDEDEDEHARDVRLTIEGTIRITDQVVAQKDEEIAELKELLDHQSSNLGSVVVGAAAIAELFDNDELIQQQREKLLALETEWEQKLRQAEIDISLERARLARDRADLEEKLAQAVQTEASRPDPAVKRDDTANSKPNRGRWLARLGLKDRTDEA